MTPAVEMPSSRQPASDADSLRVIFMIQHVAQLSGEAGEIVRRHEEGASPVSQVLGDISRGTDNDRTPASQVKAKFVGKTRL